MESNVLYHYTDFRALDSILTNGELRVNNVLNMNDATEMLFFMKELRDAIVKKLGDDAEKVEAVRTLFRRDEQLEFTHSAYAACFSRSRDDAAQWERYGGHGRGICIGFRKDLLGTIVQWPLSLQAVSYYENVQNHWLVDLFCGLAQSFDLHLDSPRAQQAMEKAWICSAAFKHPSFSSENEVRLIVSPFVNDCFGIRPQYHIAAGRIKKYYPIHLNAMCANVGIKLEELIAELIIGPESTQSLPILQDYLTDQGFTSLAHKVVHSDCPLRHVGDHI